MFDRTPGPWALMEAAAQAGGAAFDWPRLMSGARDLLHPIAYDQQRLPAAAVAALLELGDDDVLGALAQNEAALAAHPGLRERLARAGGVRVAGVALQRRWELRLQRMLVARNAPEYGQYRHNRAAVVGPRIPVVREILRGVGPDLTRAEQLRAMLSLHRLGGLAEWRPEWLPAVPAERLEELVAEAEGTAGAIEELRGGFAEHLALRETLDWDAVAAAGPFAGPAAAALAARPDCPEALRFELFLADPAAVAVAVPRLTEAMALAPVPKKGAARAARIVAKRAVADRLDPALLLQRMRPAAAVLETVRLDELAKLVEAHLGADPGRWAWVRGRLNAFPGAVAELLESAGTAAWPDRTTTGRAAFVTLLDHAPVETHLALLGTMDDQTVHGLFTQGSWRPEWVDRALTDPRRALALALASRLTLGAGAAERLATLDDAEVNGKLFRRTGPSHALRRRLLAGGPFDPAVRGSC
ncbi:hypothetical protein ACPPVO_30530 [Dactylosporangium sp. McL0621]|uniref:hypothetical protein n=1 Tax=Dactylosporangium sp. McL0621 TaxID=3415678 RepID=UPI003CEFBD4A